MGYRGGEYDGLFVASRAAYSSPVAPPPAATRRLPRRLSQLLVQEFGVDRLWVRRGFRRRLRRRFRRRLRRLRASCLPLFIASGFGSHADAPQSSRRLRRRSVLDAPETDPFPPLLLPALDTIAASMRHSSSLISSSISSLAFSACRSDVLDLPSSVDTRLRRVLARSSTLIRSSSALALAASDVSLSFTATASFFVSTSTR